MTKKFKSLSISLMIAFLLTTISCQVEESAITESKNQELLIKKIDSKKVFENKKVAQKINRLKQNTEDLKTGRIIYDSTLDFFIDTDNVVYADNGNFQTYTFPISRTTSTNTLENIVIKIENDSINTFLLNYNKNYNDVTNQQSGLEQVTCQAIDFNTNNVITSRFTPNEFCFDVYVWDVLPNNQGEVTGDTELYEYGWVFYGSNCFSFGGGGTGTSTGNYGDTGGNLGGSSGTGSGGGSGGGSNTGIVTVPTEFNPLSTQEVKSFVAQLNPDQLAWWNDEDNEDAVESIAIYLSQADAYPVFVGEAINYLLLNPSLTWDYVLNNRTEIDDNQAEIDDYQTGGFDTTSYVTFNPQTDPWPSISPVIPQNKFVGWGTPGIRRNCMDYAKAQIAKVGYQISNYYASGQTFQIYTTLGGVNNTNLSNGLSYLKHALSNGIPVIVGVDDAPGHPGNLDNSTDHFIVIVGMGTNSNGNYFQFYDNASGNASDGASPLNLLYYDSATGIISGSSQTDYAENQPYPYIVTMIRKSKAL